MRFSLALIAAAVLLWSQAPQLPHSFIDGDHPAIQYSKARLDDPATRLNRRLDAKALHLKPVDGPLGYLPALLQAFYIDPTSQTLVFSKTSFQASRISPRNPRAIYFNDNATVGYVRGSDTIEVTSLDPKQGVVFYTFDNSPRVSSPHIDRRDVCLQCHQTSGTLGIPGLMIASVFADADGMPAFRGAQALTDDRTPFEERWGGWYVTGTHGDARHRGNAIGHDRQHPDVLETRGTQNLIDLSKKFDAPGYLQPTSDIVALLTHEHQIRMTNLMIRAGWESRILTHDGGANEAAAKQFDADTEELVAYMLFTEQAKFHAKVEGSTPFARNFTARGPKDAKGRSLRDFNLTTRLFEYPLSYLIYSEAFDAMPAPLKDKVYGRLHAILTGEDKSVRYAKLTPESRQAVLEIVRATKKGLPAGF